MVAVLCYTGTAYNTRWRVSSKAQNIATCTMAGAPYTPVRFI